MNKPRSVFFFLLLLLAIGCKKDTAEVKPISKNRVFVVIGSSTAAGTGASVIDSSWVQLLAAQFNKDGKTTKVVNLALGGFTTFNVLPANTSIAPGRPNADGDRNITQALSLQPDFIIINLPSNDIANNFSDQEILENYKTITGLISAKNIPFILTSTQPRNFGEFEKRRRLKLFNATLQSQYPNNVEDYYDQLAAPSYIIKPELNAGDGIHVNNKGHRIIFEDLFQNKLLLQNAGY